MQLLPGIGRGRACKCIYQWMRCMRESKRRSGKKNIIVNDIKAVGETKHTHREPPTNNNNNIANKFNDDVVVAMAFVVV